MITSLSAQNLIDFEEDIANEFNSGKIRAPVHLYSGNENEMLKIFTHIRPQDWVLCSWRSHYQCLLKGVPPTELKAAILAGRSISLNFPEYRVFSSAIVTGVLPIAAGIGLSIKRDDKDEMVYCFLGDMTSETGAFEESLKYVKKHHLPVKFIIEDNGKSVCTDTRKAWNMVNLTHEWDENHNLYYYKYESKWPHAGANQRVQF